MMNFYEIADKLIQSHKLDKEEWNYLLEQNTSEGMEYLRCAAKKLTEEKFGNQIYLRGLIEFTNICKKDCYYCGIRCSNRKVERYRLTKDEILDCCRKGYKLGLRTFVLQGGEDSRFTSEILCDLIKSIRTEFPDCAVTLSVGEWDRESYESFYRAGAQRYLLRQETSDEVHYNKLHPAGQKYSTRIECLKNIKEIGYQTGCGFLVGSPYQTRDCIVKDLLFLQEFKPHMVGIGPFIPAAGTPFAGEPAGSVSLTLLLLSCIRLMLPTVLLPATTALATLGEDGRIQGLLHGANVIMPNLSPGGVRKKYALYDNKLSERTEAAEHIAWLKDLLGENGFAVALSRGDAPGFAE